MSKRRLIDVDKALDDINNIRFYTGKMSDGDYCEEVVNIIQNAPTVEERKHGHWIEDIQGDIKCSNCDNYLYPIGVRFQPISDICRKFKRDYCPKCGAIMNEVVDNDD